MPAPPGRMEVTEIGIKTSKRIEARDITDEVRRALEGKEGQ